MTRYIPALIAALLLAACASAPVQTSSPAPEQQPPQQPAASETPLFGEAPVEVPETKPVLSANRAVIALLDRAQLDNAGGRRDAAGVSLERALRIEPRNPWLWRELALLRLNQGQYAQAITLARKSTSFAGQDKHLQALNWRLIGDARVAQGDSAGAEQAFRQADTLEPPPAGGILN
jgi:tetratricopeptide (TPR) repeat protein